MRDETERFIRYAALNVALCPTLILLSVALLQLPVSWRFELPLSADMFAFALGLRPLWARFAWPPTRFLLALGVFLAACACFPVVLFVPALLHGEVLGVFAMAPLSVFLGALLGGPAFLAFFVVNLALSGWTLERR